MFQLGQDRPLHLEGPKGLRGTGEFGEREGGREGRGVSPCEPEVTPPTHPHLHTTFPQCFRRHSPFPVLAQGHSWMRAVWEARGATRTTPSCLPLLHLPSSPLPPPIIIISPPHTLQITALRGAPITKRSGYAAELTAHMSQHDRGG